MISKWREVTKDEFFAVMNPLNVTPDPNRNDTLWWLAPPSRRVVGRSTPGYLGGEARRYYFPEGLGA